MGRSIISTVKKNILLVVGMMLPLICLLGVVVFWFFMDVPAHSSGGTVGEITVAHGASIIEVSRELEDMGLVNKAWYISWRFRILKRLGRTTVLQAGRYSLEYGQKPSGILKSLTSPQGSQRVYTTLVITPGLTSSSIASRVEKAGLARSRDVLESILVLADAYAIKKNPEGLQGYLFPDTYKIETPVENSLDNPEVSRKIATIVIRMLADRFFEILNTVDPAWMDLTKAQLHEKVTLASIVEREYRVPEEAPEIAAVFNNRIHDDMPLQSCATVVYTIEETEAGKPFEKEYLKYNRRIFERYLEIPSAYNTYYNLDGLPPGPISSPGRVSLKAAFFPADIDALFFVVKDPAAGTHTFTRYYADHQAAKETYLNQFIIKD